MATGVGVQAVLNAGQVEPGTRDASAVATHDGTQVGVAAPVLVATQIGQAQDQVGRVASPVRHDSLNQRGPVRPYRDC